MSIEKPREQRKMFVVWSGGCDSTYLLDDWSKYASINDPIYAVSFEIQNVGEGKLNNEREARRKIKEKLKDRPIKYIEIKSEISDSVSELSHVAKGVSQPQLWLGMLIPFLPNNAQIAFGYIQGDCFWHYRQHVDSILAAMAKMKGLESVSFHYPMEWVEKFNVIGALRLSGLYEDTWWCEDSYSSKPCGWCGPCMTHKTALHMLDVEGPKAVVAENEAAEARAGGVPVGSDVY